MHAAPRHKLPHCFERMKIAPPPVDVAPHEAAVIVCFVIAPAWRRRGVASALLDFALADFAARGIAVVDAFPFKSGASTDATDHYHGPASLFASRGFVPVADHPDLTVVRKQLVPGVGTSSSRPGGGPRSGRPPPAGRAVLPPPPHAGCSMRSRSPTRASSRSATGSRRRRMRRSGSSRRDARAGCDSTSRRT
ncbi:MAG: GNAT family N-acetyltransferase [Betaproteobacteria bacterium]|nr:GNAT family N-acetyltransferase [Betaproteobacteria bacterium]